MRFLIDERLTITLVFGDNSMACVLAY